MISGRARAIHLDTSFLIRALVPESRESVALGSWLGGRRSAAMCTLAWGGFLCGPLEVGVEALAGRVVRVHIPVGTDEASEAARLLNETGRRRGSFQDCIIAATALTSDAALATSNSSHFGRFVGSGLELMKTG